MSATPLKALMAAGAAIFAFVSPAAAEDPPSYVALATASGAQSVAQSERPDGGVVIGGSLEGRQFAVAIPKLWNHQSLVFAHGYTMPDSSVAVSPDPLAGSGGGALLKIAYDQGFAVGHSAYGKAGIAVESGAIATLRLNSLIARLGSKRSYVAGGSMGGSIVMALIEQHPQTFAGALSACGVTDGWEKEVGAVIDMRAVYNYFAAGTPYVLPGSQDLGRSALPTLPPHGSSSTSEAFQTLQVIRIASPLIKLFGDAKRDPAGPAAVMIRKVSSLTAFDPDPAAFIFPLITVALGMDDMRATFGGNVYGNRDKIYASSALTADENAAFNRGVQRLDADPAAQRYGREWHQTRGDFKIPLVAVHNQIDALVPYSQAKGLEALVAAHGDPRLLTLITVPPQRAIIPGSGVEGYMHCGFTQDQYLSAWSTLRAQVEKLRP